ncbi:MAG: hypothetical protein ASARMPREDX12_001148 [Alectoria sarmentosa]|nr:MAG: hypothetical protein ASARMPREDX12_001148 [Alectoria sarmentosa]
MDAPALRLHGFAAGQGADTATPTPDWVMLRTRLPSPDVGSSITPRAISNHYVLKISVFSSIDMLTVLTILQSCLTAPVLDEVKLGDRFMESGGGLEAKRVGLPPEEREATKQPTAGGNAVKTMAHGHRRGNLRSQQQEQGYQDYGPRACEALTQPAPRGWRLVGNSQLETDEIPAQPSYISAKGARRPRW